MADMDLSRMSPEEVAETAESAQKFLRAARAHREDAKDNELVWVRNPKGRPEPCLRKLWRTHLSRKTEQGWSLMTAEEIAHEQEKIENARKVREKKQKLWSRLPPRERVNPRITGSPQDPAGWQEYTVAELEEMVEATGYPKRKNR